MIKMVKECQCVCHDNLYPSGHDGLCCEYPNAYKKAIKDLEKK